jgi:hypothetical protein
MWSNFHWILVFHNRFSAETYSTTFIIIINYLLFPYYFALWIFKKYKILYSVSKF